MWRPLSQRKIPGSGRGSRVGFGDSRKRSCANINSMRDEASAIPLADVLRAANELVSAVLIKDYVLDDILGRYNLQLPNK